MDIHLATRQRPDGRGIQCYAGAWSRHGARYEAFGLTFPERTFPDSPRRLHRDSFADALTIIAATGTRSDVRVFTANVAVTILPRRLDGPAAAQWLHDHHPDQAATQRRETLLRHLDAWGGTITVCPPTRARSPHHVAAVRADADRAARDPDPFAHVGYRTSSQLRSPYRNVRAVPTRIPAWTGPETAPVDTRGHHPSNEFSVPQIRAQLPGSRADWIPVRATGHEDADVFDNPFWHWHIDLRFAGPSLLRQIRRISRPTGDEPHVIVVPTHAIRPAGHAAADRHQRYQRGPDGHSEPYAVGRMPCELDPACWQRVAPMTLQRLDPANEVPPPADACSPALQDHCAGRPWTPGQRCPHRGASLLGVPARADGLLVCPVHRLVIDTRTGRVPSAAELRQRLGAGPNP